MEKRCAVVVCLNSLPDPRSSTLNPSTREDSVLFIHDYIDERLRGTEQYGKALAAFDMIELVKVSQRPRPEKQNAATSSQTLKRSKPESLETRSSPSPASP
jgi:hypothetical protein